MPKSTASGKGAITGDLAVSVMERQELLEAMKIEAEKSLWVEGFSDPSLAFFDDYPEDIAQSNEWWKQKKDDYESHLKPEFQSFVEAVIETVSKFDKGIELNAKACIGRSHTQDRGRALPYRWAAIHSSGTDRRIDVQFFLNLTSLGLRIGIYSGENRINPGAWSARRKKIVMNQHEIFDEVQALSERGYALTKTTKTDHALKNGGTVYAPASSEEMAWIVVENSEIDVLKTLNIRDSSPQEILAKVIECFVETRKLYQLLQPSSYSNYARDLV
jgi:uncharacterized protein (DUF2461 family)